MLGLFLYRCLVHLQDWFNYFLLFLNIDYFFSTLLTMTTGVLWLRWGGWWCVVRLHYLIIVPFLSIRRTSTSSVCKNLINRLLVTIILHFSRTSFFILWIKTHTTVILLWIEVSAIVNTLTHIIVTFHNELSYYFSLLRHFNMLVSIFTLICIRWWVSKDLLLKLHFWWFTFNNKVFMWWLKYFNFIFISNFVCLRNLFNLRLYIVNFIRILLFLRSAILWLYDIRKYRLLSLNKWPQNFIWGCLNMGSSRRLYFFFYIFKFSWQGYWLVIINNLGKFIIEVDYNFFYAIRYFWWWSKMLWWW